MTYGGAPASSTLDAVRMLIGDTSNVAATEYLTDNEVNYFVNNNANVYLAAADACRALAAQFALKIDRSALGISDTVSNAADHFLALARRLEARGNTLDVELYAGGLTDSDKDSFEGDTDRTQSIFRRGMHSNSGYDPDALNSTNADDETEA